MDNQTDHQKLSAWLHEWQLDQAMADAIDTSPSGESDAVSLPPAVPEATESEQVCLQSGDVLLLKPLTPLTRSRPVYVLTLGEDNSDGRRQVIPFARFSTPATYDEALSGLAPLPLRVLCWWNWRRVPEAWLQVSSWWVYRVDKFSAMSMHPVGNRLRGPSLEHPLDPRHDYLDAERALWEELAPAITRWQYPNGADSPKQVTDSGWEQARAAEDPDDEYGAGLKPTPPPAG